MNICIVGKYPPIQGGVATRTFNCAHALAARGHRVHVVTNAKEVEAPYRVLMREEDWSRCDADCGRGAVILHWTDPVDRSQFHIPASGAFVTKLVSVGSQVCADHEIDVIFSFYMEPYGIAGHLIAEITGLPHVLKTAGSDAGRLWKHPQFTGLYSHVFKSADLILTGGQVARNLAAVGVEPDRIIGDPDTSVPEDLFTPEGLALDVAALVKEANASPEFAPLVWGRFDPDRPYIGVYGKLGPKKGTYPLLDALAGVIESGRDAGLLVMGHSKPEFSEAFRDYARKLKLEDHIVQLPFLPYWRVPEFIRACRAVCCLEQDFPISFRGPIIPREVLSCGACLVGSLEVVAKMPTAEQLVDGYNCVVMKDVNDRTHLTKTLCAILEDPDRAHCVGKRGRLYAVEAEHRQHFPDRIERLLSAAAQRQKFGRAARANPSGGHAPLDLAQLAVKSLPDERQKVLSSQCDSLPGTADWAKQACSWIEQEIEAGDASLAPVLDAIRLQIFTTSEGPPPTPVGNGHPFRLKLDQWAVGDGDIVDLIPRPRPELEIERFEYDARAFFDARAAGTFPANPIEILNFVVRTRDTEDDAGRIIVVDPETAAILDLCDGSKSVIQVALAVASPEIDQESAVARLERLFEVGLIDFQQKPAGR